MRKRIFTFVTLCVAAVLFRAGILHAGFSGEFISTLRTNNTEGASQQSFTKRDFSSVNELRFSQDTRISDNSRFSLNAAGRASNDPNIEAKDWSLINLSAVLNSYGHRVSIGNFAPNFTEFTLSQSLIGLGYQKDFAMGEGLSLAAAGGAAASTWNTLTRSDTLTDYRQYVGGIKLSKSFSAGSEAGVSVVHAFDDESSLQNPILVARKNTVVSGDFNLNPVRRLTVSGEIASSVQNYDVNRSSKDASATALQTNIAYGFRQARFSARFYRAGSDFQPLGGAITTDSEQWKFSWRQNLGHKVVQILSYNVRRNNLENRLASTTRVNVPALGWEYMPSRPLRFNFDARLETRESGVITQTNDSYQLGTAYMFDKLSLSGNVEYRTQATTNDQSHTIYVTGLNLSYRIHATENPVLAALNFNRTDDYLASGVIAGLTQTVGLSANWTMSRNLLLDGGYSVNTFASSLAGSRNSTQNNLRLALNYRLPVGGMFAVTSGIEFNRRELTYSPSNNDNFADNIVAAKFSAKF